MTEIEDEKLVRKEITKKIAIICVLLVCLVMVSIGFNFLENLSKEPEYTQYTFDLGDTEVHYNHETLKIKIKGEGTYKISKVYNKTNTSEHWSGYDLGKAPLDTRINGVNIADDFLGNREVLYLKLERVDTNEVEYVEVNNSNIGDD